MSPPPVELQAFVLGLVQGVCEFLPISSSAHLVVLPEVLGWPYLGKAFDVALHLGTLIALVTAFRRDLVRLGRASQRLIFCAGRAEDPDARLVQLLVVASIPAAVAGFLLDDLVETHLQGLAFVGALSILWGMAMGWADLRGGKNKGIGSLTPLATFGIGCAQATALLPGTSRSGATITAALLLGLSRAEAARFSLLLSIPIVAGATLFKGWSMSVAVGQLNHTPLPTLLIGITASACTGRLCLTRFVAYLEYGDLRPFARYRVAFGLAVLGWILST